MMPRLALLLTLILALLAPRWLSAAEPTLEELVDDLQQVSKPGYGYTGGRAGSEFLPYPGSGDFGVILFGGPGVTPSPTLKKLVERGAEAIPVLIKHLDDARPIKMAPVKGMMWMSFEDEYDFNRQNVKVKPVDVNRDHSIDRSDPRQHALTVGDLCFVALGQIVNRHFNSARYAPTAGLVINSPSYSKRLRTAVVKEWGTLTRDEHRRSLINDFLRPDYADRRIGAYQRLTFYYPETVEKLVLDELQTPTFELPVVQTFCEELYKAQNGEERRELLKTFTEKHGPVYVAAVQNELFQDLRRVADYQDQTDAQQIRLVLNEVFQYPLTVKESDAPYCEYSSAYARQDLIAALVHDRNPAIGEKVREIYLATDRQDFELRDACLLSMASRSYADLLLDELAKIDAISDKPDQRAAEVLAIIATSPEPKVKSKLTEILHATRHAKYFVAVLPALGPQQDAEVLKSARVLLAKYADEDAEGTEELLEVIRARYRNEAKAIFRDYLRSSDPQRAAIMGTVLWYGDPWAAELLAPFLDEQRDIPEFPLSRRVCDHVAQAIKNGNNDLEFDIDWALKDRDKAIEKIKAYCAKQNAANQPNP